jgi:hypothetical protein
MWETDSLWFEIAIVSMIFAIGNILMGHFEEQTPKVRRVGKYLLTMILICGISTLFGREAAMGLLAFSHSQFFPFFTSICTTCQKRKE